MMVRNIEFDDLHESYQNIVLGMVELTGMMLMGGEYGKRILNNMAVAYVKHRLLTVGEKLLYTTANLTERESKRYDEILRMVLTEEAYKNKVEYGD